MYEKNPSMTSTSQSTPLYWANDTTSVSSVYLTIGSEVNLFQRVEGELFTYEWKTKDYENGQYSLTITAEDGSDYTDSIT